MTNASESKVFKVRMSERCFRFKPDALSSHAPHQPGVYEFVIFDKDMQPIVLFVGLSSPATLYEALGAHLMGRKRPFADDLFKISTDVYFDYVMPAGQSPEDLQDVAASLAARHKPRLNNGGPSFTGRYASVEVKEEE